MSEDRSGSQSKTWLDKLFGAFSSDTDEPSSRSELLQFLAEVGPRLNLDQDAIAQLKKRKKKKNTKKGKNKEKKKQQK